MAHYTIFLVLHNDGYTQQFVGNPQSTREKALDEVIRLTFAEDYDPSELEVVEVPN